jgi:hypothetical protein
MQANPDIAPPSFNAHGNLRKEIIHYTVLRFIATKCSKQTMEPYRDMT